jgi:hypothetical protein
MMLVIRAWPTLWKSLLRPSRIALALQSQNVSDSLEPYVLPTGCCAIFGVGACPACEHFVFVPHDFDETLLYCMLVSSSLQGFLRLVLIYTLFFCLVVSGLCLRQLLPDHRPRYIEGWYKMVLKGSRC